MNAPINAAASGTFALGGDLPVHRLGYGTMQLTGPGVWGGPADPDEAVRLLRRAVDLGVNLMDTADSYGPCVAEELVKKALHPYPEGFVVATKAGLVRPGPGSWAPVGRPEYLRQEVEMSLRRLGLERLDLLQLHRIDPKVPLEEQIGVLAAMQQEGKIRHIGLSEVDVDELVAAQQTAEIVSVQNLFNLADRHSEALLDHAAAANIAFIPWFPLATGGLIDGNRALDEVSARHGATTAQVALAWLLQRSPVMLPIPGTSSVPHLEDNVGAAGLTLSDEDMELLAAAAPR